MAKYIAVKDFPPNIKQGDEVKFRDKLGETVAPYFRPVSEVASEEDEDKDDTVVTNPDREKLKARANELGIPFAPNIPTARLMELIKEKEAELADDSDGSDVEDADSDDSDEEDANKE